MATATRYAGKGNRLTVTAPTGGYANKEVVVVRTGATGMIGVAIAAIAAGESGEVEIDGIWVLPKKTGTAHVFSVGDICYWDVAEGNISTQASANVKAGICTEAAVNADTTIAVKLIPSKA